MFVKALNDTKLFVLTNGLLKLQEVKKGEVVQTDFSNYLQYVVNTQTVEVLSSTNKAGIEYFLGELLTNKPVYTCFHGVVKESKGKVLEFNRVEFLSLTGMGVIKAHNKEGKKKDVKEEVSEKKYEAQVEETIITKKTSKKGK